MQKELYSNRFSAETNHFKQQMYQIFTDEVLQHYISNHDTVFEIGGGYCEIINSIKAKRKIVLDINPDARNRANPHIEVIIGDINCISTIPSKSVDVVIANNFLEHLTREQISFTLAEVFRILTNHGRFLIMQPNIRYCYKDYWMFFDHITPLDHRSMEEILSLKGFILKVVIPKYLPYTTNSHLPKSLFLFKLFLRIPLLQIIFGKQMFLVAEKITEKNYETLP